MEQFGKYQLIRRIGSGGMAEIFLARTAVAQGLAKELVIKKIHPAHARSRRFVSMFVAEAKIALGLNHPNIVQVFDFGTVGETFFLAMEHLEGIDLLRMLQASLRHQRAIPLGLCAYIVQQIAKGLDYAHRKHDELGEPLGIVHRDISPQNVLVSWDGAVKIVDFGIAHARGLDEEEGVVKGKYSYMSPEQARGEPVDQRSDVYSTGVVLFELCCQRPLFPGRGKEAMTKVKAGAILRPRNLNPDISERLEGIILTALSFHPGDRFASARALQVALSQYQFERAQSARDIVDSESLAQFLAEIVPPDEREGALRPGASPPRRSPDDDSMTDRDHSADGSLSGSLSGSLAGSVPGSLDSLVSDRAGTPAPAEPHAQPARERKHVMVLEGHVCGLPALQSRVGTSRAGKLSAEFLKVARDIAFKHHGVVHRIGDDGITILIGLPVAREDDASRTIRMGMALIDALDGIGHDVEPELRLAVGIQRGAALVSRESRRRATVELAPAESSLARRLSRQAHGAEIMVGSHVYQVARADWSFDILLLPGTTDVPEAGSEQRSNDSGYDEDSARRMRVYRLRGPKERAERLREQAAAAGELVGRDLELKALRDAYRDVLTTGKKRQLVIVGEAGVGKRTLVNAFLAGIPTGEAVIMRTTTQVATAYTPYAVIADLARDLLGLAEAADPQKIHERLEMMAPLLYPGESDAREARGVRAAISMLLGVPPRHEAAGFDAQELRQRLVQVMQRFDQRVSPDKPVVIIGEDVHWADDESIDVFRELLLRPSRRPILGIVTARPEARITRIAGEMRADIIRLGDLDPDSSVAMILARFSPDAPGSSPKFGDTGDADDAGDDAAAGSGPSVADLARQIVAHTGGNPFFIKEMLDSLCERDIIALEPAGSPHAGLLRWVSRDALIQVPTSVEALLSTRIDRLPDSEKETLTRAAVLGRASRADALTALLGRLAQPDLDALTERELLARSDGQYLFRNDMSMTVAYGLLPAEERTRLHRLAAQGIAGSPAYRAGQDDAVIARHLELAGDAELAAERYLGAAAHAVDVGGNGDALRQLNRALKLLPAHAHARRFDGHRQREEILRRLARRPRQLREIRHLRDAAEALGDPARLALAHTRLARFYIEIGKIPSAARAIGPALEHARAAGDQLAEAEAMRLRASLARLLGQSEEALALCGEALDLCDESREGLSQRALTLHERGAGLWNMGDLEAAIESFAEALVIYRMLDLPRREASSLNNMGIIFAAMGDFEEALAHYKSALKLDQELGDHAGVAFKLGNIGQTYADIGDLERGERYLLKAITLAEQTDEISSTLDAVISLGQVHLARGDIRRALVVLERGLEMALDSRERYQEIRALTYLAMTRLEAGYPAEGPLELARSATDAAAKMPMPVGRIYGLIVQGLALAELGQSVPAADASAEAVRIQATQARPQGAEQILYIHAALSEAAGRMADAREALILAHREVEAKTGRLGDAGLRAIYLASKYPSAIRTRYRRLVGDS